MGVATPPPPAKPRSTKPPAEGDPLAQTATTSRFHFDDRPVAMGPSGASILLVIVVAAVGVWLYLKPPGEIGPQALQKYSGFETNMEAVVLRDCAPPGCAAVYLTPLEGKTSLDVIPGAVALAGELEAKGIEFFIIFAEEPVKDAVKRARSVRHPVVFDPHSEWAKEAAIEKAPYWIAWRTGGKIRLRSAEPVSAAAIEDAIR